MRRRAGRDRLDVDDAEGLHLLAHEHAAVAQEDLDMPRSSTLLYQVKNLLDQYDTNGEKVLHFPQFCVSSKHKHGIKNRYIKHTQANI